MLKKVFIQYFVTSLFLLILSVNSLGCPACEMGDPKLQKEATRGNSRSQYILALQYTMENADSSFYWMKKSADNGFVVAYQDLSKKYLNGYGTDTNITKAIYYLEKYVIAYNGKTITAKLPKLYAKEKDYHSAYKWTYIHEYQFHKTLSLFFSKFMNLTFLEEDNTFMNLAHFSSKNKVSFLYKTYRYSPSWHLEYSFLHKPRLDKITESKKILSKSLSKMQVMIIEKKAKNWLERVKNKDLPNSFL